MIICCGMRVYRMWMLGVSVRKMKALTVNMETGTLIGKGRMNLTCFMCLVYAINSTILFLGRRIIFSGSC
jgi:hypothetical protein